MTDYKFNLRDKVQPKQQFEIVSRFNGSGDTNFYLVKMVKLGNTVKRLFSEDDLEKVEK